MPKSAVEQAALPKAAAPFPRLLAPSVQAYDTAALPKAAAATLTKVGGYAWQKGDAGWEFWDPETPSSQASHEVAAGDDAGVSAFAAEVQVDDAEAEEAALLVALAKDEEEKAKQEEEEAAALAKRLAEEAALNKAKQEDARAVFLECLRLPWDQVKVDPTTGSSKDHAARRRTDPGPRQRQPRSSNLWAKALVPAYGLPTCLAKDNLSRQRHWCPQLQG